MPRVWAAPWEMQSLLDYLKTHDTDRYRDVITKLGIRK